MKTIFSLFILFMANSLIASAIAETDNVSIKSGFFVKDVNSDEGQIRQLYYGKKKLGQLSSYSISPSGQYAAFQDKPAGHIYLYRVDDDHLERLTREFIATTQTVHLE